MREHLEHPAESELLLAAEGEPAVFAAARVRAHLAHCDACRTRQLQLQRGLGELTAAHQAKFRADFPSHAAARARLHAELRRQPENTGWSRMFHPRMTLAGKLIYALATLLFVGGAVGIASHQLRLTTRKADTPRASLTPGDAILGSSRDVCASHPALTMVAIPSSLQAAVLREYGISHASRQNYELDYLITPQLGGATSLRNLWPEPYFAKWNAHVKDQLEVRLHEMVCNGELDLATAQHEIATDWVAAYRKYFHTSQPLPAR